MIYNDITGSNHSAADLIKHILKFEKSYRWELWGKLLKRSLFNKEMLYVDRNIKVFEDYIITLRYLSKTNRVVYIPNVVYNYRLREGSSTSRFHYTLNLVKAISPLIMDATHHMYRQYDAELRINQLSLLSSVIGDKQLNKHDEWYLQVKNFQKVVSFH